MLVAWRPARTVFAQSDMSWSTIVLRHNAIFYCPYPKTTAKRISELFIPSPHFEAPTFSYSTVFTLILLLSP